MNSGPDQAYRTSGNYPPTIFDLSVDGAMTRLLCSEYASRGLLSSMGILDKNQPLPIIRSHLTQRLAA
jgi:hypothetical protein